MGIAEGDNLFEDFSFNEVDGDPSGLGYNRTWVHRVDPFVRSIKGDAILLVVRPIRLQRRCRVVERS